MPITTGTARAWQRARDITRGDIRDALQSGAAPNVEPPINPHRLGPVHATEAYRAARKGPDTSGPIRKRRKLPLVDDPPEDDLPDELPSSDTSCSRIEPEAFPTPFDMGSECPAIPLVDASEGKRVLFERDATIGEIFRQFGGEYLDRHRELLGGARHRVIQELALCRTERLGWSDWACEQCGCTHRSCNPCRNRHCPQCSGHLQREWLARHKNDLVDLPYHHVILTAPHEINVLIDCRANYRVVYNAFFWATRDAILEAVRCESDLLAEAGMLVVLHSWSQLLLLHLHTHILLPAGGWSVADPTRLVIAQRDEWLAMDKVMQLFRKKLINELLKARKRGELQMTGPASFLADDVQWKRWTKRLKAREWKFFEKPPVLPAEMTLEYLGRYAQRVAIGNSRIRKIDLVKRKVTFSYRDNHGDDHDWGSSEEKEIDALEFIDRFLLHVMPARMTRVRKFGWWSVRKKSVELPRIRAALGMLEFEANEHGEEEQVNCDGDTDLDDEANETIRIVCRGCKSLSMVRVAHYPKPTSRRIMTWVIWPELDPDADQMIFPAIEPYLPGGSLFHEAMGFT